MVMEPLTANNSTTTQPWIVIPTESQIHAKFLATIATAMAHSIAARLRQEQPPTAMATAASTHATPTLMRMASLTRAMAAQTTLA